MHGGKYTEEGSKKSSRKPILFTNVDQTTMGTSICPPDLGTFAHFLTTRPSGVNKLFDRIFPGENREFSIILLCTYCTLELTATLTTLAPYSTCHVIPSRNFHLAKGVRWRYRYQILREHISRLHAGNYTEGGSKDLVVSRTILIMWTKLTQVLLLVPLRLRPLLLHILQSRDTETCFLFSVGRAKGLSIPNCTVALYQTACLQLT